MMEKINAVLSDEESMKQISELAKMLTGSMKTENSDTSPPHEKNSQNDSSNTNNMPDLSKLFGNSQSSSSSSAESPLPFDFATIMQIGELINTASANDKNSDLLLALKPHLKEDKQEKVDKAVKILKLLALWAVLKESGLLKNINLLG